jgi:hypothetical protein
MADVKDLKNTHTFKMDLKLPSGEFSGTFTVHRPTIAERLRIGAIEARELEGLTNADIYTSNLAHIVALCDVILDDKPTWFNARELRDVEVIQEVYTNYVNFLNEFQQKPKPKEDSPATSG